MIELEANQMEIKGVVATIMCIYDTYQKFYF